MVDVDLPKASPLELILHSLIRIVARNRIHPRQRQEAAQLAGVEEFSRLKPNTGIRVDRTHSGLRGICSRIIR
jgi:hypothetical protein